MVGGGMVLLDDEDAGADPADRKLLVALRLDLHDLEGVDLGGGAPFPEESDQGLDVVAAALGVGECVLLVAMPHPAEHPELARPPDGGVPEAHIQHLPGDPGADRPLRLRLLRGHRTIVADWRPPPP